MSDFFKKWGVWLIKLTAILITLIYFVVISIIHNSPYIWLSVTLVLMLCLTMLAYTRDTPLIRWRRRSGENQTSTANNHQNEQEPEMTEVPAAIWMTDIPPSYSFVMETNPPVTPPPSYGSALVMFPWIATGQQSPDVTRIIENARFRSISRQVSETSGIYNCNTSVTLSRQTSRQDGLTTSRQLSAISRQISQATVLSRQISKQENKCHQEKEENDENIVKKDEVELDEIMIINNNEPTVILDLPHCTSQTALDHHSRSDDGEHLENMKDIAND